MCVKLKFCSTCVNALVQAWAKGDVHEVPGFGDYAQRNTATELRVERVCELLRAHDFNALEAFPEWNAVRAALKLRPAPGMREVLDQVPYTVRRPGFGVSGRKRRKYRKWLQRWNSGGAYHHLKEKIRHHLWGVVQAAERERRTLAAAA
jgi:hypothetical protein